MKCAQCGEDLVVGAKFCGICGMPAPAQTAPRPAPMDSKADQTVLDTTLEGRLLVKSGKRVGQVFELQDVVRIGRTEENDIVLEDAQVSRHHATISQKTAGYDLQDLNSSNGTFLNGNRIVEPQTLKEGDQIQIGSTTLVFRWTSIVAEPQASSIHAAPPTMMSSRPSATPQAPVLPVPATAKPSTRLPVVLGAILVVLACAIAAFAGYYMLSRSGGKQASSGGDQTSVPAITMVVTNSPVPMMTVVVTNSPEPTNTPEPTITSPPGPMTVHVVPDGSGDYASLEAAVDTVPAESTITLAPGTYRLTGQLTVDKSLTLRGAGMDQTFVVGDAGEYMVKFTGLGSFVLEGITFRYEGTAWTRVVVVEDGIIDFAHCRFTGAVRDEVVSKGGSGLRVLGNTMGIVRECRMEGNGLDGVSVQDQSQPTLAGNVVINNTQVGIAYWDDAGGMVQENECSSNGLHGITVNEQAQPVLERNVCRDNEQVGIRYAGTARGVARENECIGNGLYGMAVVVQAQPTLEDNICTDNAEIGIRYSGSSGGSARRNECARNGLSGIVVVGQAQPALEGNTCTGNTENGIAYFDNAGGMAQQNTCSGNGLNGILVTERAQPALEGNFCQDNQEAGIHYSGGGGGVARQNTCTGNQWGIYVNEVAVPDLSDNECYDNIVADTVLFADNFDNSSGNWQTGVYDNGEVRYKEGELRILDYNPPRTALTTWPTRHFTDVVMEVESRLVEGAEESWHGFHCRFVDTDNYYKISFRSDGRYTGHAMVAGERTNWPGEQSDAIRRGVGVTNKIRLACIGNSIRFWVNDTLLLDVTDDRLSEGDIALGASAAEGNSAEVAFDSLIVVAP